MSLILVNPPTLHWPKLKGRYGQRSYLDDVLHGLGGIEEARHFPIEHIGLFSIKAWAKKKYDLDIQVINGITAFHKTEDETFDAIKRAARRHGDPKLIGFSGPNLVFEENLALIKSCKETWPDVQVVLGHDFAMLNHVRILTDYPQVDFICRGDGDDVFPALGLMLMNGHGDPQSIPGLAGRRSDGSLFSSPSQPLEIDELPWPARDELAQTINRGFGASISSSRGCPYRCSFCTTGQTAAELTAKKSYRVRDIHNVVEELEYMYKEYNARHFVITDDLFLTRGPDSKARAETFAREVLKRKLAITYMFDCRVDSIDLDLFKILREAGLYQIFVGIETGSDEQRAIYNKKFGRSVRTVHLLRGVTDLGVRVASGIITYHPNVSKDELERTLDLVEQLRSKNMYNLLNRVQPYPGTPLYEEYKRNGWLADEWPIAAFKFQDPYVESIYTRMMSLVGQPGTDFESLAGEFRVMLKEWTPARTTPPPALRLPVLNSA